MPAPHLLAGSAASNRARIWQFDVIIEEIGVHSTVWFRMLLALIPWLMVCMAAVSMVSLMLVRITPAALFNIPIFFVYCAAIVVVRARMKMVGT